MPPATPHAPNAEVKAFKIAEIEVWHGRKFRIQDELKAFAAKIKEQGQLVAAVLAMVDGTLVMVDGHDRLEALKLNGETEILAWVDPRIDTREKLLAFLFDSQQRSNRSPADLALQLRGYKQQHGLNGKQTAAALGLSEATVSRHLSLFDCDDEIVNLVGTGELNFNHLAAVAKADPLKKTALLLDAAARKLKPSALKRLATPPKAKRGRKPVELHTLRSSEFILSFPPTVTVEDFEKATGELREQVALKLKQSDKKQLRLVEVTSAT